MATLKSDVVTSIEKTETKEFIETKEKKSEEKEVKEIKASGEAWKVPFLKNSDTFILLDIPAGKPSRKELGKRAIQSQQKGSTCFYYALKMHAMMHPNYLDLQKQQKRKWVSDYRKAITELSAVEDSISPWIESAEKGSSRATFIEHFQTRDKSKALAFLRFINNFARKETPLMKDASKQFDDFDGLDKVLTEFEHSESPCFKEYVKNRKYLKRTEACRILLKKLGFNPEEETLRFHNEQSKINILVDYPFKEHPLFSSAEEMNHKLDLRQKDAVYQLTVNHHITQIFDLKPCSWKPTDGIQSLFNLIKEEQKPMVIVGLYGDTYYNGVYSAETSISRARKAKKIGEIGHYHIYGYAKGSHKEGPLGNFKYANHAIDIIGVEMSDKDNGYVYYLDPMDKSAPDKPRIVNKMSYAQFAYYCLDNETQRSASEFDYIPRSDKFNYGLM